MAGWLSEHVGVLPEDRVRIDQEGWAQLAGCVERREAIRATYQTFDGRVSEYDLHPYHIMGGEAPIKVRLLFESKLAVYITERQWHSSQGFRLRSDGRVEMRLETTGRKELVRWVLSWMPDVKALAPKSLRDRIAEKMRDGLRAQG